MNTPQVKAAPDNPTHLVIDKSKCEFSGIAKFEGGVLVSILSDSTEWGIHFHYSHMQSGNTHILLVKWQVDDLLKHIEVAPGNMADQKFIDHINANILLLVTGR